MTTTTMLDVPRLLEQLDAVIKDVSRAFLAADAGFGAVGVRDVAQQCLAASSRLRDVLSENPKKRKMETHNKNKNNDDNNNSNNSKNSNNNPCESLAGLSQRKQARQDMLSVHSALQSGCLIADEGGRVILDAAVRYHAANKQCIAARSRPRWRSEMMSLPAEEPSCNKHRLLWKQPEKRKMKTPCELLTLLTQRMQARLAMVSVQLASRSGCLMLDACPPSDAGSAEQQLEKLDPSFAENRGAGAPPEAREGAGSAAPPPKVSSDPEAAKCCYAVLGLLRAASPADVRRAYHTCARASHPDKPGGSHAAFLAVAKAFEVLSIHAERARYDASLFAAGSSDGVLNPVEPKEPAAAPVQQALNAAYLCLAMLRAGPETWARWIGTLSGDVLKAVLEVAQSRGVIRPDSYQDMRPGATSSVKSGRVVVKKERLVEARPLCVAIPDEDCLSEASGHGEDVERRPGQDLLEYLHARQEARTGHSKLAVVVAEFPSEPKTRSGKADVRVLPGFSKTKTTKGVIKRPDGYIAKVGFEGLEVQTRGTPDVDKAIVAHIALLRMKDLARKRLDDGIAFNDAVSESVADVRAAEEFALTLAVSFGFGLRNYKGERFWVPTSPRLKDVLLWRKRLLDLADAGVSVQEMKAAQAVMMQEALAARRTWQCQEGPFRRELVEDLLAELAQRDSLAKTGAVAPELEALEDQRSQWYLLPLEPKVTLPSQRRAAENRAAEVLARERPGPPTSQELLEVLRLWGFAQNDGRQNVRPEGHEWVHSDSLGIIRRRDGQIALAKNTAGYPQFVKLLGQWLQGQGFGPLPFTTITINFGYAARRHRDRFNDGPSAIAAFGDFVGGRLRYWPADPGKLEVDKLPSCDSRLLDVRSLKLFDGNKAHEVEAFEGERFSVVFFTVRGWQQAQSKGLNWPTMETLESFRQKLLPA
ncbi:unnamed protein product [Polarella glacialis]|uniref:J domain-containing protein n=1 Tax=Polarella glacialis TaxID=89957 RepID=A0A813IG92_POLGL|nr:unnamed protein product [Polarella glacialis]